MNSGRSNPPPMSSFGLVAWLEKTRISLPLKGVECRFQVNGAIACVEMDQIYHQSFDRPLDITFTFPLPSGAAAYRCELHINGRVIRAKVEEEEKARQIYREQKAAGRRAALVETERENLFTLSLGNVQPGDLIVVRFAWFQVLDRIANGLRLMVPTCPGVRYIPGKPLLRSQSGQGISDDTDQVPDASRISPPRIDALHPDAAYFSLEGRISRADAETATLTSPSHPVCVRDAENQLCISIFGQSAVPDRDFVLVWHEPKTKQLVQHAWQWTEAGDTYALVQLRAPETVSISDDVFQDFYFLVDRSGSMNGIKWQRTCEALHAFVGLLGPKDRVKITLFESDFRDFAEAPLPAPKVRADRGFRQMEKLGTQGGTDLLPAVRHVLGQVALHSKDRRATVLLITDGQVGNEQTILNEFKKSPNLTVHSFGIDTAVNDAFLKALASQHRGGCWLQTPDEGVAETIAALGDRLRRPVITDLSVCEGWENAKPSMPDLHAREVVTLAFRGNSSLPLQISGRLRDGKAQSYTLDLGADGTEAIKLLWAKERIAALQSAEREQEAIACAKQYNLLSHGTAFIAWDEVERIAIARDEIVQPVIEAPVGGICSSSLTASPRVSLFYRLSKLDDLGKDAGWNAPPTRATNHHDRAEQIQVLREALKRAEVPPKLTESLVTGAEQDDTLQRCHALEFAAIQLFSLRSESSDWISGKRRAHLLTPEMGCSPEAFIEWVDRSDEAFRRIMTLCQILSAAGTPRPVIHQLVGWLFGGGRFSRDRLEKLAEFANAISGLPFSTVSQARHWYRFLDEVDPDNSGALAPARHWVAEMESGR